MSRVIRPTALIAILTMVIMLLPAGPGIRPAHAQSPFCAITGCVSPILLRGWTVNWEITTDDGIRIFNVTYNGILVLRDARVTGVIVQYLDNPCFFYDQFISSYIGPPDNGPPSGVYIENVTSGGFQIRGDYDVPGYDYNQIWRFYPDGHFMGLVEIGGGGCVFTDVTNKHIYQPHWKYDFAIGQDNRNSFFQYTGLGWVPVRQEIELVDNGLRDPSNSFTTWKVAQGRRAYYIAPIDGPEAPYSPGTMIVVQQHLGEIENSVIPGVVNPEVYLNQENVWRTDIAFFYISKHLHNPSVEPLFDTPVLTGLAFYPSGY